MDRIPPLAGDISWMMQSAQVSDRVLTEALVQKYYWRLCRLAKRFPGVLGENEAPHRLVLDTLARAVIDRQKYWGAEKLGRWLGCRMLVSRRKLSQKWPLSTEVLGDASAEEIQASVDERVRGLMRQKQSRLRFGQASLGVFFILFFVGLVASAQWLVPSDIEPAPQPRGRIIQAGDRPGFFSYTYSVEKHDTLTGIAERAGVSVEQIAANNFLYRPYLIREGAVIEIPSSEEFRSELLTHVSKPVQQLPRLSERSTSAQVFDRFRHLGLNHSTLRANLFWVDYGPPGYLGPVQSISQYMVFMRQPDYWSVININYIQGFSTARFGHNEMVFSRLAGDDRVEGYFSAEKPDRYFLPYDDMGSSSLQARVVGEGVTAGRPAVILEEEYIDHIKRYWFDVDTAFPLRIQLLSKVNPDTVIFEVVTTSIEYDLPIPVQYFDPGRAIPATPDQIAPAFGYDALTDRLPGWLSDRKIPEDEAFGTPLASLPVTVGFPGEWNQFSVDAGGSSANTDSDATEVTIFRGNHLSGTINTLPVTIDSCLRSPDGRWLAFFGMSQNIDILGSLAWLPLDDIASAKNINRITYLSTYAYDPGNTSLALAGCFYQANCGIYILDLPSGTIHQNFVITGTEMEIDRLAWSPNGTQIAFTHQPVEGGQDSCGLTIIQSDTGEILFTESQTSCNNGINQLSEQGFPFIRDPEIDGCLLP